MKKFKDLNKVRRSLFMSFIVHKLLKINLRLFLINISCIFDIIYDISSTSGF